MKNLSRRIILSEILDVVYYDDEVERRFEITKLNPVHVNEHDARIAAQTEAWGLMAWQAAKLSAFKDVKFTNEQYMKLEAENQDLENKLVEITLDNEGWAINCDEIEMKLRVTRDGIKFLAEKSHDHGTQDYCNEILKEIGE